MAIRYTPGQFRDALGLTKETFRYWKRDLPALAVSAGHSPCFGPGELVATAIVKCVTGSGGVPVSRLANLAPALFAMCRKMPWPQLEQLNAILFIESGRVEFEAPGAILRMDEPAFIIPLRPLVERLRERLLDADIDAQRSLALLPVALSAGSRR